MYQRMQVIFGNIEKIFAMSFWNYKNMSKMNWFYI